jgi:hypothetical protein
MAPQAEPGAEGARTNTTYRSRTHFNVPTHGVNYRGRASLAHKRSGDQRNGDIRASMAVTNDDIFGLHQLPAAGRSPPNKPPRTAPPKTASRNRGGMTAYLLATFEERAL